MSLLANSIGLPLLLPYQAFMATLYLGHTLVMDIRQNVAGYVVQGEAAASGARVPSGRLLLVIGGVLVVGVVIALISTAAAGWTYGTAHKAGSLRANTVVNLVDSAAQHPGGATGLFWAEIAASPVLLGIVLILGVAALRRWWVNCPFHPLGLVVAFS